jgi:hypothetical protein
MIRLMGYWVLLVRKWIEVHYVDWFAEKAKGLEIVQVHGFDVSLNPKHAFGNNAQSFPY